MPVIITRSQWTRQPQYFRPINTANPITNRIAHAYLYGAGISFPDAVGTANGTSGLSTVYGNKWITADGGLVLTCDNTGGGASSTDLTLGDASNYGNGSAAFASFSEFSFTTRIYLPNFTANYCIYGTNSAGIEIRITTAGKIDLLKSNTADLGSSTGALTTNKWYSIGVGYSSPNGYFYINGAPAGTISSSSSFGATIQHYFFSRAAERCPNGTMLQAPCIWNKLLTPAEFASIANNPWQVALP